MSSSLNAVFVLPVPDTAWKKTCPPTLMKYDVHITTKDGMDAFTREGMSVYIRAMACGNAQNMIIIIDTIPYDSFNIRLTRDMTLS